MSTQIPLKTVVALILGIFLFAFATQNNFYILPQFLGNEGLSIKDLDFIELLELLSYILAGFMLTQLVNVMSSKKIIIFSSFCFILALICLITLKEHKLFKIYFMIMAASSFSYISLSLIKIVEYTGKSKNYGLAVFFLLWVIGHIWGDEVVTFFNPYNNTKLFINIVLYCLVTITVFFNEEFIDKSKAYNTKFSILVENIELQVITGFIVSYITMYIFWYYDVFAVMTGLAVSNMTLTKYYMLLGILIFIIPVMWLLSNANKYLLNLLLVFSFLLSLILLPIHGMDELSNIFLLMIMGLCLCSIFICNISIISDKFEGNELKTSLLIYFAMASIGSYCGAFAAYIGGDITSKGFISSICAIVVFFLVYYLWRLIKLELY